LRDLGLSRADAGRPAGRRTERDLSMKFVGIGVVVLLARSPSRPSLHMNLLGALLIVAVRLPVRDRVVAADRRDRLLVQSDLRHDGGHAAVHLPDLPAGRLDGRHLLRDGALGRRDRLHRLLERRHDLAGFEDRLLLGATPKFQQWRSSPGASPRPLLGPILLVLNDSATVYVPMQGRPAGLHTDVAKLKNAKPSSARRRATTANRYPSGRRPTTAAAPPGKYLVNDAATRSGWSIRASTAPTHDTRPTAAVRKFDAPKATLMSYIIKGILDRKLPWALVLLGVMIAVTLQLSACRRWRSRWAFTCRSRPRRRFSSAARSAGWWTATAQQPKPCGDDADELRGGERQEPGRAARLGLHRGRGDRGHHHRDSPGRARRPGRES
jgi:hypothetical protein